jgi:hypothetical protein
MQKTGAVSEIKWLDLSGAAPYRRVSDGGPDDSRWVAGICPNCRKEIHHGINGKEVNQRLQDYLRTIEGKL